MNTYTTNVQTGSDEFRTFEVTAANYKEAYAKASELGMVISLEIIYTWLPETQWWTK